MRTTDDNSLALRPSRRWTVQGFLQAKLKQWRESWRMRTLSRLHVDELPPHLRRDLGLPRDW